MENQKLYDICVIGAGACGIVASIQARYRGKSVLLLEKLPQIATKLKATGGGRCNLTNSLDMESFIASFGKNGRFIQDALKCFDNKETVKFFDSIGVKTHSPDGFRVFPTTHNSSTIIEALQKELDTLKIDTICDAKVLNVAKDDDIFEITTQKSRYRSKSLLIATGGKGYASLGSSGDGYELAKKLSHKIVEPTPAMMPLKSAQKWVANCRADTIAKVTLKVAMKKYSKLQATGDLIFTKDGIRGPVVLDFSREITPLLKRYDSIELLANFTKGLNAQEAMEYLKKRQKDNPTATILELLTPLIPASLAKELSIQSGIDTSLSLTKQKGVARDKLYKLLAWTPLTIIGHDGFKKAMVTRGGVSIKEINPKTMESKIVPNLYFCGEVVDIDGPCGGYNLQWAFSSGVLASRYM